MPELTINANLPGPTPSSAISREPPPSDFNAGGASTNTDTSSNAQTTGQPKEFAQVLKRELKSSVVPPANKHTADASSVERRQEASDLDDVVAQTFASLLPLILGMTDTRAGMPNVAKTDEIDAGSAADTRVASTEENASATASPIFSTIAELSPASTGAALTVPRGQGGDTDALAQNSATAAITAGMAAQIGTLAADDGRPAAGPASSIDFDGLIARAEAALAQSAATDNGNAGPLRMATTMGAAGWDHEIGDKLTWMVGRQAQHAQLVLHPPELGRVEVSLSLKGDHATVAFASANPLVRDALEAALPRLREILADAGVSLGQTQVGSESFHQARNNGESGENPRGIANVLRQNTSLQGIDATLPWLRRGNGLVDTFA